MKLTTKQKGNIAELAIAADLAKRGFTVALPYGEYGDWDLLVDRHWAQWTGMHGKFERVQVKYAALVNGCVPVRNRCHSVTAGRVRSTYSYNDRVDWVAVYEPTTDQCYYIHNSALTGELLTLRVNPTLKKHSGIRWAKDYTDTINLDATKQEAI